MSKQKSQDKGKMSEIDEQILKIFDIKKRLGKGAYGIVWKAIDRKTLQTVAVKKIFDAFRNETDAQRTFREIMFLRSFRNHENIIQLHSIHRAANHMDIYLSFEFMESDLHNVIKRGSVLKDLHKRYIMYQLFNATKYIHSGNVIHRDLKPSNVLIDSSCRCKIADFGLARSVALRQNSSNSYNVNDEPILTDYVATRWYRAPEILVASKNYTKGIDLWSLGCILAEMIRGKPLFPGSCTVNQVERIVSALPEVTESDIKSVGGGFGTALLNQSTSVTDVKLDDLLQASPEDGRHLVKALLIFDPTQRLTAKQALEHRYVEKFRRSLAEPELETDIIPPFRDDVQLSVHEYRSKLYELISSSEKTGFNNLNSAKSSGHKKRDHHYNQFGHDGKLLSHSNKPKLVSSKSVPQSSYHCDSNSSDSKINSTKASSSTSDMSFLKKSQHHDQLKKNINAHRVVGGVNGVHGPNVNYGSLERPVYNTNCSKTKYMPKINYPIITPSMSTNGFSVIDSQTSNSCCNSDKLIRRASIDSGYPSGDGNGNSSSFKTKNSNSPPYNDNKLVDIKNNCAGDSESVYTSSSNYFPCAKSNHINANSTISNVKNLKQFRHSSLDLETRKNGSMKKIYKNNSLDNDDWRSSNVNTNINADNHYDSNGTDIFTKMNYENRLKILEAKIKKHKLDMKTFLKQDNHKCIGSHLANGKTLPVHQFNSEPKLSRTSNLFKNSNHITNNSSNCNELLRSKSDNYTRTTQPHKHLYHHREHTDYSGSNKINRRGNNYGVINASDLIKLRSSELIH